MGVNKPKKKSRAIIDAGLYAEFFPKTRGWALDQDYIKKLNAEERAFLGRFNEEFYKGFIKVGDQKALNKSDEHRKDCYRRNNSMGRDLLSKKEVLFEVDYIDDENTELEVASKYDGTSLSEKYSTDHLSDEEYDLFLNMIKKENEDEES